LKTLAAWRFSRQERALAQNCLTIRKRVCFRIAAKVHQAEQKKREEKRKTLHFFLRGGVVAGMIGEFLEKS